MKKEKIKIFILLLPAIFIVLGTILYPVLTTFKYSLKYFKLTDPTNTRYLGLENYKNILRDPKFHNAFKNSLGILIYVLIIGLVFSLLVALILKKKTRLSGLLLAISIIPWALPPIVNGIIWKFIFFPGYGLLNKIFLKLNLITTPISFISNKAVYLLVVAIVVTWRMVPFCALIILARLESIPKTLYEAIEIDGASPSQTFRLVTLPLLKASLALVALNLLTAALNVFDEVISLSGYLMENETLLVYNYSHTFSYLDFGYGSAVSYTIMLISAIFGLFYIRNMTREVQNA